MRRRKQAREQRGQDAEEEGAVSLFEGGDDDEPDQVDYALPKFWSDNGC